ncbi:MAG: ankyrin repeat domain-containing protein [Treponemataceae bacterium]|nr:ankyrin repeat domain-containing protein [Treponemataceae bacterium]
MYAAQKNAADVAKLLIKTGADVNVKNNVDKTALMYAEEKEAAEVLALLKAAGAKE